LYLNSQIKGIALIPDCTAVADSFSTMTNATKQNVWKRQLINEDGQTCRQTMG